MPTYEYACRDCGNHLEVVQSFSEKALTRCPTCKGTLKKVFSPVGIVLKGSGFYRTDNRAASSSGKRSSSESGGESGSGGDGAKAGADTRGSDTRGSDTRGSDLKATGTKSSEKKSTDKRSDKIA